VLLRREVNRKTDSFDPRLVMIRRAVKMSMLDHPVNADWWWMNRHGRFESLTFALVSNAGGAPLATVTGWGMELHAATRGQRLVGMTDLYVSEKDRRKGYGKALILDVIRRLKEDLVTHVEVVIAESDTTTLQLFTKVGFEPFDLGVVYRGAGGA
jgi:ribosomal protein S18 acetylase RimI-like enzyme